MVDVGNKCAGGEHDWRERNHRLTCFASSGARGTWRVEVLPVDGRRRIFSSGQLQDPCPYVPDVECIEIFRKNDKKRALLLGLTLLN